ncbi:hypothetical protein [Nostoc sp. ATCC 53789]|uniref:hypothetical protein n=1 Tax=Nostoc sp. ATCC 53789 TaxID=76335 RepID=UPI000DEC4D5A|nr:hypothetical protein [Nostoc sp. ATCC 53789]QHG17404.1 hypothetical protein GJB62_16400 [Nostoc sp. ATCC 53789]RCJ31731.1 hypothetical protein A6V25_13325 [Nostoc sp. ATCC 53789]
MKKVLSAIALVACLGLGLAYPATANQQEPKQNQRPPELDKPGEVETKSKSAPNYLYPDNSSKTEAQLIKKENAIGKLKKDLRLKQIKLAKYSEYLENKKQRGGDIIENLQVHPKRLVWIAEIDAPLGINMPRKNGQYFKSKKSSITIVVDAETGQRFDTDIVETA